MTRDERAPETGDVMRDERTPEPGAVIPPRSRRVRVIWNPNAGSKAGLPTNRTGEDDLRRAMEHHGLGDELIATESEEDAIRLTREAVDAGYDVVAAAGGDGTVGTVARQLLGMDVALGILPLGSMMNLARSLGIPRDVDAAAGIVATGQRRRIDVGDADGAAFFEAGSVGMNAALFEEGHRFDEGHYGALLGALRVMLRYRPGHVRLEFDGRVVDARCLMVSVSNAPFTGFGLAFAPDARMDDGLFDVCVFERFSRSELIRHLVSIAAGRRRYSPKVTTYRTADVTVSGRRPLPCRVDDQDAGPTPTRFRIRPGVLLVLTPPDGTAP